MDAVSLRKLLALAEEAAWLSVCLCEESGNEALKATNAYAENKKALKQIREFQEQHESILER